MQGFGFYWWPWQPKPQFVDRAGKELPIMVQHWVPLTPEDPALVCKAIAAAPAPVKGGIGSGNGSGKAPAKKDEPEGHSPDPPPERPVETLAFQRRARDIKIRS